MNKRKWVLIIAGILIGLGILVWWWPFPRLPGEIAVRQHGYQGDGIYIFKPGRLLTTGKWRRITPSEVYVWHSFAWSPDYRQVAFRCSDGYIHCSSFDRCWLNRPDEVHGAYDSQRDIVKHGVCLVDRDGENFRWIAVSTSTFNWRAAETFRSEIWWTLDGRYIIFQADRYDIETGERRQWAKDMPVQDPQRWYVDLPHIHIPKEVVIRSGIPCTGTCLDKGWTGIAGSLSTDRRYVIWAKRFGESDPQELVVYDMQVERLLRLPRIKGFRMDEPVWLPSP